MNERNIITVEGCSYDTLKRTINQWITIHKNDLPYETSFKLYKNGLENHIVKTDDNLDNNFFSALTAHINTLQNVSPSFVVYGFTAISGDGWFPVEYTGNDVMLFFLRDNLNKAIYGVTQSGSVFSKSCDGEFSYPQLPKSYRGIVINFAVLKKPEEITTPKKPESKTARQQRVRRQRLNIALGTLGFFYILSLTASLDPYRFLQWNLWLPVMFAIYLFTDNMIPHMNGTYYRALGASLLIFAYSIVLSIAYDDTSYIRAPRVMGCGPLVLVLLQRYGGKIFKKHTGRFPEPERDRNFSPDNLYWAALWIALIFICIFIGNTLLPLLSR